MNRARNSVLLGLLLAGTAAGCTSTGTVGLVAPEGDAATDAAARDAGDACPAERCEEAAASAEAGMEGGLRPDCISDGDCSEGDEAFCDLERGRCIQCRQDADCRRTEAPVCAPSGECTRACTEDAQCDDERRCAQDLRLCTECVRDADCVEGVGICDPQLLVCLECSDDRDCSSEEPYCVNGRCDDDRGT